MRKQKKKLLSMVLSAAMVVTLGAGASYNSQTAEAADAVPAVKSALMYGDKDWGGCWDAQGQTIVTGDGSYTMTFNDTASHAGIQVFVVDLENMANLVKDPAAVKVSNVKVLLDGEEIAVDQSKINVGDSEEKGNIRISLNNPNNEIEKAKGDAVDASTFAFDSSLTVSYDIEGIEWKDVDWTKNLSAQFSYASDDWNTSTWGDSQVMIQNDGFYEFEFSKTSTTAAVGAQVLVVDLMEGANKVASVDDVEITDVAVYCDGKAVAVDQSKVYFGDSEENGNLRISLNNKNNDIEKAAGDAVEASALSFTNSLKVRFKISGVAFKEAVVNPPAPSSPTKAPTVSQNPTTSQNPASTVAPTKAPTVKNACTKVKAKKAKVTVKKGKKATLKFTVTAKTKSKKTTDKLSVSVKNKKIVSVSKKSLKKGSATVTIKGKKKGSTKVTVKVGKKSAKVTVKVK